MKSNILLIVLVFIITINPSGAGAQAVNTRDSLALVDLYNSTNGSGWNYNRNWLNGPVNTWFGITVTGSHVATVSLNSNNLTGALSSSIGNLTHLTKLSLRSNSISGIIPSSIGNLANLTMLGLDGNQLTDTIPASIGNLTKLMGLYLYLNKLTGKIPSSFGNLTNLYELDLFYNELTGSIPASMGNLTNIRYVVLSHNHLTGEIPSSFIKLTKLLTFNIDFNNLMQIGNGFPVYKPQHDLTVKAEYNFFTFDGIEQLAKKKIQFMYAPQSGIHIHQYNKRLLSVYAGGTVSNNTYTWYQAGQKGSTVITGDSTFSPLQSGMYYAQVTNAIATGLTLFTDTVACTIPFIRSETANQKLSVYPNPAKGTLTINGLAANGTSKITITDYAGNVWLNTAVNQQATNRYTVSKLKPGNYVLTVINGNKVRTIRFIKE